MKTSGLSRKKLGFIFVLGGILLLIGMAYAIATHQPAFAAGCMVIPFAFFFLVKSYESPVLILFLLLFLSFLLFFIGTYLVNVDGLGLAQDFILVFAYFVLFLKGISQKIPWQRASIPLVGIVSLWMFYVFLELFNPQSQSSVAWFYGMRSIALYMWLFLPIGLVLLDKVEHLNWFITIWGIFVILASLWGARQLYFGLNAKEQVLMAEGLAGTHILHGRLRVFSFYSDAGQFGAAQAHAGITAFLLAPGMKNKMQKLFMIIVGFAGFYGLFVSGTRGAMFIPIGALLAYLFIKRNIKVLIVVGILGGGAFGLLKYTYVGQGVYSIARMRSAFNPDDASFQVRLANQRKFKEYLKSRPFGGGIGVTGTIGKRFSPNAVLSKIATDSGYVKIWAECGVVGLLLYLGMWAYIGFKSLSIIWYKLKNPWMANTATAFICGIAGMLVANYGNAVITQVPSSFVMFFLVVFIFVSPELEKQLNS